MTGEQPGVEYKELGKHTVFTTVLRLLYKGEFEEALYPPAYGELLSHLHNLPEVSPHPSGSFFVQLNANQRMADPDLTWCAVEYDYEFEGCDFSYWPTTLLMSSEAADTYRMQGVDDRLVYQLEWDSVCWVRGYPMILGVDPADVLSGRN